jgi:hypothetical protein
MWWRAARRRSRSSRLKSRTRGCEATFVLPKLEDNSEHSATTLKRHATALLGRRVKGSVKAELQPKIVTVVRDQVPQMIFVSCIKVRAPTKSRAAAKPSSIPVTRIRFPLNGMVNPP